MDGDNVSPHGMDNNLRAPEPGATVPPGGVAADTQAAPPAQGTAADTAAVRQPQPDDDIPAAFSAADNPPAAAEDPVPGDYPIRWVASEFIAHHKSANWYLSLGGAAVVITVIIWFLTRDTFATVTVIICMLLLGVYAGRKPRDLEYMLDESGLTIGERHYPYAEFRSFSVQPEDGLVSVELTPLRRFALYTTLYLNPADEDRVVGVLGDYLPMEEPRNDLVDNLMRRLHF